MHLEFSFMNECLPGKLKLYQYNINKDMNFELGEEITLLL